MFTNIIIFIIGLINIGLMGTYFHQSLGVIFGMLCILTSVYLFVSEKNICVFKSDSNKIQSSHSEVSDTGETSSVQTAIAFENISELEKEGMECKTPDKNE